MEFAEYFNTVQEKFLEGDKEGVAELANEAGSNTVSYSELEEALSTLVRNAVLAIEENKIMQEIKLNVVLRNLKECGIITKEVEDKILESFKTIENLLEEPEK